MSNENNDNLYCKVCVLANELADYNDTPLTKQEVKEIFSNNQNLNFDIEHNHKYLSGVDIVENYVSKSKEEINDTTIPEGSWLMTLNIINPELRKSLEEGVYTGVSLETYFTDDVEVTNHDQQRLYYKDVLTKDEMTPITISFTDKPANMLPLELMSRKQYTAKTRGGYNMSEDKEDEVTFLRNFIERLFTHGESGDANVTQKSLGASLQPTAHNGQVDDLIDSLVESQKSIPGLTDTLNALTRNQTELVESVTALSNKINEVLLNNATESLNNDAVDVEQVQEESTTGESQVNTGSNPVEVKTEPETSETTGYKEQEEETDDKEDTSETETVEDEPQPTSEDTPVEDTSDDSQDDEEKKKRKQQNTQKNIRGASTRRPLNIEKQEKNKDDYKTFMINRSYENLVGRNN